MKEQQTTYFNFFLAELDSTAESTFLFVSGFHPIDLSSETGQDIVSSAVCQCRQWRSLCSGDADRDENWGGAAGDWEQNCCRLTALL